ncbi:MAG TPA: hypothetical protein VFV10_04300 [Gammaproteobacteria bacterium]|nr:hypothetical protein [Gammaproteobacteria bacterium]
MKRPILHVILAGTLLASGYALANDVEYLQICVAAAADYSAVFPTENIPSSLRQVSAVFALAGDEGHDVTGEWYAVDVGQAAPPNYRIAASSTQNVNKGRFVFTLPRALPIGKYRLDVAVDGKPWKSAAFNVVEAPPAPRVGRPADLIPALPGRTWTYDFMQQGGEGAKVDLPDVVPDAEGRYRATVVMSVAGEDANGRHVELRRNGKLVFEEWWRFDSSGMSATKRKQGGDEVALDPPQVMWRWPLDAPASWTYTPNDRSYEETFQMWGPIPVPTPEGERPGFLVLAEQRSAPIDITAEREFVPGLGLVREVDVTTVNGNRVSHEEMSLRAASTGGSAALPSTQPSGTAPAAQAIGILDELSGAAEAPAFHTAANGSLAPRVGRLVIAFPAAAQRLEARVEIHDAGAAAAKKVGYGNLTLELRPARYDVSINGVIVRNVPVLAGQDTFVHAGVLHTRAGRSARVNVYAPGGQSAVKFAYGETALGFPAGDVDVAIEGQRESVRIEYGKITEY